MEWLVRRCCHESDNDVESAIVMSQSRRIDSPLHPSSTIILGNLLLAVDDVADMTPVLKISARVDGETREVVESRRDAVEEAVDCNATGIRPVARDHRVGVFCQRIIGMAILWRSSKYC